MYTKQAFETKQYPLDGGEFYCVLYSECPLLEVPLYPYISDSVLLCTGAPSVNAVRTLNICNTMITLKSGICVKTTSSLRGVFLITTM